MANPEAHPWLWPRMGGIAEERLLGASLPFPGYPELGLTGTSAGVAEMSAVGKLASPGSRLGPWYVESVVGELSAHLGQAWAPGTTPMLDPGVTGTRLAGDVGGRHLIGANADQVHEVPTDNAGVLIDLDTPEAVAAHQDKSE